MKAQKRKLMETEDILMEIKGYEVDYGLIELHWVKDQVLNEHELMLLHMFYYGGYSVRELAKKEGITEGNFKVRMLRIRNKVKQALKSDRPRNGLKIRRLEREKPTGNGQSL